MRSGAKSSTTVAIWGRPSAILLIISAKVRLRTKIRFRWELVAWVARILWLRLRYRRRLMVVRADKIGHLALHTSVLLDNYEYLRSSLGLGTGIRTLVIPDSYVCNDHLWRLFTDCRRLPSGLRFKPIKASAPRGDFSRAEERAHVRRGALYLLLDSIPALRKIVVDVERVIISDICLWTTGPTSHVLASTESQVPRGSDVLYEVGLVLSRPVVTVIDRDGTYFGESQLSPRDAGIDELTTLIRLLLNRGYQVIRMGSQRGVPIPIDDPSFVDYPFVPQRSPRLDIELLRAATLAIGWNTGLTLVPYVLGVPTCHLHIGADMPHHSMFHAFRLFRDLQSSASLPSWTYSLQEGEIAGEQVSDAAATAFKQLPYSPAQWASMLTCFERWGLSPASPPDTTSLKCLAEIKTAVASEHAVTASREAAAWSAATASWRGYWFVPEVE